MEERPDIADALADVELGPLRVKLDQAPDGSVPTAVVEWGPHIERFAAEMKWARSLGEVQGAAWQAQRYAERLGLLPLVIVPYLSERSLGVLREEGVNGIDLSGNGTIEIPGQWWFYQKGNPNRYPRKRRSRATYRGKSALVGRVLLIRPRYEAVGEVQEEIEHRGGVISLSQVSKVLSALEDDLVIRKTGEGIRLLQPKKLLDALAEGYRLPKPTQTLETKAELGPQLFDRLTARAAEAGARIAGFEPQRYVIAPQSRERLTVYVEPAVGSDLASVFELDPVSRFSNLDIRVIDEPGVYFDLEEDHGFRWCPPLEVYLQFMQSGKREQEIAQDLRPRLLDPASS